MKQEYKILLIALLVLGLLDTLGSISSRQLDFNYSFLSPFSFIIYGTAAFLTARQKDITTGVLFAAILGLFDSTIGWKLSMILDANTGDIDNQASTGLWIMTAVLMTGSAALVGFLGGGLTRIIYKKSTNAQQKL